MDTVSSGRCTRRGLHCCDRPRAVRAAGAQCVGRLRTRLLTNVAEREQVGGAGRRLPGPGAANALRPAQATTTFCTQLTHSSHGTLPTQPSHSHRGHSSTATLHTWPAAQLQYSATGSTPAPALVPAAQHRQAAATFSVVPPSPAHKAEQPCLPLLLLLLQAGRVSPLLLPPRGPREGAARLWPRR